MQHYGPSLNSQLNETRHYTSTPLTLRKHSTMWIGEPNEPSLTLWSTRKDR
ncbi:unnamed protein product [Schistosoma margrebowiei]|uniref:Uncharacterized protein n=1 Tax=Schistosoma margrebowiei TaxID=48269 RepID=A0A3P8BSP6_9TREM|nr:unnamed protein product [Schistosoma margrebowiei]